MILLIQVSQWDRLLSTNSIIRFEFNPSCSIFLYKKILFSIIIKQYNFWDDKLFHYNFFIKNILKVKSYWIIKTGLFYFFYLSSIAINDRSQELIWWIVDNTIKSKSLLLIAINISLTVFLPTRNVYKTFLESFYIFISSTESNNSSIILKVLIWWIVLT